jgi:hypothetical protein
MKSLNIRYRLCLAVAALATVFSIQTLKATPYASCITNNAGTIQFYLNESGGNVTVTFDDNSKAPNFNGVTTGLNVTKGLQSFSLVGHNSYTISVSKTGTGSASVINTMPAATPRGIDVNKRPGSPYFGYVYAVNAAGLLTNAVGGATNVIRLLNSDLSAVLTNGGGVSWVYNSASSPYRIAVNEDDFLTVGDFSSAHSGVWRIDPTLNTNQLILGPIGQTAGYAASSQGDQFSRPLLIGNFASGGNCVLFTVDAGSIPGVNNGQLNSVLVYSNISSATIPRITTPDLLGPEVTLNLALGNNYPGITTYGGYLYCSNRRDGPSGGSANLQIYALSNLLANTAGGIAGGPAGPGVNLGNPNAVGCVWNSYYNGTVNDYFATASPGSSTTTGPADSAVSSDGKYIATVGYGDNHIEICGLTNGIPDVSTIYNISNTVSLTSAGRGICWDAADNVYVSSSGGATFQEWSLGFTATAVTTGNASGTTGFSVSVPSEQVGVMATNSAATTTISQQNPYGTPTNATFVITRTGNTSSPLSVSFSFGGTAASGTYTTTATNSLIIASGQSSTNIIITAISDNIPRPTTTIVLTLGTSGGFTLAPASATLTLLNTGPQQLVASAVSVSSMYNAFSNDYASFIITRSGDTNAASYAASGYTYGGTAVAGVDYTLPGSVTFNPGDLTKTNYIYPLNNGQPPMASSTNAYVGNKTVIIGFTGTTNTVLMNILDSAYPTTAVLFSDSLTDPNDAANWGVTAANNNMQTNAIDTAIAFSSVPSVAFGYDLQNGDPGNFGVIPLPPSGVTNALRVTVNKSSSQGSGAAAGVNLYPTNVNFSGNYAVRFSMNVIEGYNAAYTTEGPIFGINHSGIATNWWASGVLSGWGTPPSTAWESDGVWYWTSADGGSATGDYIEYTGVGGALPNTGWTQLATTTKASFTTAFKTNVFTSSGGPGLAANNSILNASPDTGKNWMDVEIKQLNNIVTLALNKTTVFVYTNTTTFTNGTLMLGYDDPYSSVGASDGAVYYSNLRVVSLAVPYISQIAVNNLNGTVVINFTSVDGDTTASSFALQRATAVTGVYADVAGAVITQLSAGAFQAVVPQNGSIQFYRIRQK